MRRVLLAAMAAALFLAPAAGAWTWPVHGPVVQPFVFDPAHPYAAGQHRGIDVGADDGAVVVAPAAGTVTFAGAVPASGKSLTITTPTGYAVTLTHLGVLSVAAGATVAEGDAVATVGASGEPEVGQPYVHVGIRVAAEDQGYLDPLALLPPVAAAPQPSEPPAAAPPMQAATPPSPVTAPAPVAPAVATPAPAAVAAASPQPAPQPETSVAPAPTGRVGGGAMTVVAGSAGRPVRSVRAMAHPPKAASGALTAPARTPRARPAVPRCHERAPRDARDEAGTVRLGGVAPCPAGGRLGRSCRPDRRRLAPCTALRGAATRSPVSTARASGCRRPPAQRAGPLAARCGRGAAPGCRRPCRGQGSAGARPYHGTS